VSALLLGQQKQWQIEGHRDFSEHSIGKLDNISKSVQD